MNHCSTTTIYCQNEKNLFNLFTVLNGSCIISNKNNEIRKRFNHLINIGRRSNLGKSTLKQSSQKLLKLRNLNCVNNI